MKKFTCHLLTVAALCTFSLSLFAQENTFTTKEAIELVKQNAFALSLSDDDLNNCTVSDAYMDKLANVKLVYLQQTWQGVPVYNAVKTIAFKNDKAVSNAGSFIGKAALKSNAATVIPVVSSSTAISQAAAHLSIPVTQNIVALSANEQAHVAEYASSGISKKNISVKLLWLPAADGSLILSWQVKILPFHTPDMWLVNVNAVTGNVTGKFNLTVYDNWSKDKSDATEEELGTYNTVHEAYREANEDAPTHTSSTSSVSSASYRVVPFPAESPAHPGGTPTLIVSPWTTAGSTVAPLGWHNDGTTDHDSTRGNNVWAREDRADNDGIPNPGRAAASTTPQPDLTFDFPFSSSLSPTSSNNQKFALTQLFYWNNIMHDISYLYGFDEVAGNFQNSNLGRGGVGGDYVIADAQDGGGTNNANFGTDVDGQVPRMQMYLWTPSPDSIMRVNSPSGIAGSKRASESNFSANNKLMDLGPITADLVMYDAVDTLACSATTNNLAGKIAVMSRGSCGSTSSFSGKVKNAQNAGAVAVIVINNTTGNPFAMGGNDQTVTIPAVMVSLNTGNAIKAVMRTGQTVNVTLKGSALDGDVDNGVMGHEYTHGISTRLTGGPSIATCLDNIEQMGEGWSDFFALMTTTNWATATQGDGIIPRGIGNYVTSQNAVTGVGIRTYPYTTNMTINPWTYTGVASTSGEPHAVGEIWTTVLWDMTWNMIQVDGINPNLYNPNGVGGNSAALKLVTEGMKLQPCRPGFLDGRDGILKADTLLYNGRYSCAIWNAFARRGMGVSAVQGSSNSYTDQVNAYDVPVALVKKSVDKIRAAMNEEITYTLTATCQCASINGYTLVDTLPINVTYVSGGTYNSANRTVTFTVPSLTPANSQSFTLKVKVNTGTYTPPVTPINDDVPSNAISSAFTATATGAAAWSVSSARSHTGTYSYHASDAASTSQQTLTTSSAIAITGISTLSFWHYFSTEAHYDGGVVELSANNGANWFDAGPYMYQNGYNSEIGDQSTSGFSGTSGGQFIQTLLNLSSFAGKSLMVRFVFTSDAGVGGDGWYLDDITLTNEAGVYNVAELYSSTNQLQSVADTITRIDNALPLAWGSFTAVKDGGKGLLKWTTIQESNTREFVVERSSTGNTYAPLGRVRAAGNSNNQSSYSYVDAEPVTGINYYRIKQVDNDGRFAYSETRALTFGSKSNITVTPNPAKDKVLINVDGGRGNLQVIMLTVDGKKVKTFTLTAGNNVIDVSKLASGVYYLQVSGENVSESKKLVKQ